MTTVQLAAGPLQQTRQCENRSVFIHVVSIEYSLVRNWQWVPWEISRSQLTFPRQNTHKFWKLFQISWSLCRSEIFIITNTAVHFLTGPLCKLWEHRFSVPGLASIPPPPPPRLGTIICGNIFGYGNVLTKMAIFQAIRREFWCIIVVPVLKSYDKANSCLICEVMLQFVLPKIMMTLAHKCVSQSSRMVVCFSWNTVLIVRNFNYSLELFLPNE